MIITVNFLFAQSDTLPKPTGKYFVWITYLSFIDDNRKELFDKYLKDKTDIDLIEQAKKYPEIEIATNIEQ